MQLVRLRHVLEAERHRILEYLRGQGDVGQNQHDLFPGLVRRIRLRGGIRISELGRLALDRERPVRRPVRWRRRYRRRDDRSRCRRDCQSAHGHSFFSDSCVKDSAYFHSRPTLYVAPA